MSRKNVKLTLKNKLYLKLVLIILNLLVVRVNH